MAAAEVKKPTDPMLVDEVVTCEKFTTALGKLLKALIFSFPDIKQTQVLSMMLSGATKLPGEQLKIIRAWNEIMQPYLEKLIQHDEKALFEALKFKPVQKKNESAKDFENRVNVCNILQGIGLREMISVPEFREKIEQKGVPATEWKSSLDRFWSYMDQLNTECQKFAALEKERCPELVVETATVPDSGPDLSIPDDVAEKLMEEMKDIDPSLPAFLATMTAPGNESGDPMNEVTKMGMSIGTQCMEDPSKFIKLLGAMQTMLAAVPKDEVRKAAASVDKDALCKQMRNIAGSMGK